MATSTNLDELVDVKALSAALADRAGAANPAREPAALALPPAPSVFPGDEMINRMRTWIQAHGARCTCTAETEWEKQGKPTPGRKRPYPAGCKLHWRRIGGDMEHAPEPHDVSLVTRFCKDTGFQKRRDMFDDFAEALRRERFELPTNPTERNLVLSDGRRVEAMSGFVHGWMDVDDQGEPIDAACYRVAGAPRGVVVRAGELGANREILQERREAVELQKGARALMSGSALLGDDEDLGSEAEYTVSAEDVEELRSDGSEPCGDLEEVCVHVVDDGPHAAPAPDAPPNRKSPKRKAPKPARRQTKHEREYDAPDLPVYKSTSQGRSNRLVERNGPLESLPMEAAADRYRKKKKKKKTETPTDAPTAAPSVERHYQGHEPGPAPRVFLNTAEARAERRRESEMQDSE